VSSHSQKKKHSKSKFGFPTLSLKDLISKSWKRSTTDASSISSSSFLRSSPSPKHRYGGLCIYESQDQWGKIEVIEDQDSRRLHFGNSGIQGRTDLEDPWLPRCTYVETMGLAGCLLDRSQIQKEHILLLGLGSGGLAHTMRRLYPDARLDIVELRSQVVEVAHRFFKLDEVSAQVHVDDAFHFVNTAFLRKCPLYHIIMIDLYLD
jgi:spermidine synthase